MSNPIEIASVIVNRRRRSVSAALMLSIIGMTAALTGCNDDRSSLHAAAPDEAASGTDPSKTPATTAQHGEMQPCVDAWNAPDNADQQDFVQQGGFLDVAVHGTTVYAQGAETEPGIKRDGCSFLFRGAERYASFGGWFSSRSFGEGALQWDQTLRHDGEWSDVQEKNYTRTHDIAHGGGIAPAP